MMADDFERHRIPTVEKARAECFIIAKRWRIDDRESRLQLAEWVVRRDVESWSDLSRYEWSRLLDALRGWEAVRVMRMQSGLD